MRSSRQRWHHCCWSHHWTAHLETDFNKETSYLGQISVADPGGAPGAPPPNMIQFFRFHMCFCQKAPASDVGAPPPNVSAPSMGNPGSAA